MQTTCTCYLIYKFVLNWILMRRVQNRSEQEYSQKFPLSSPTIWIPRGDLAAMMLSKVPSVLSCSFQYTNTVVVRAGQSWSASLYVRYGWSVQQRDGCFSRRFSSFRLQSLPFRRRTPSPLPHPLLTLRNLRRPLGPQCVTATPPNSPLKQNYTHLFNTSYSWGRQLKQTS